MSKRILAITLAMMMALALVLTGCGGNDSATTTAAAATTAAGGNTAATTAVTTATTAAVEVDTLTYEGVELDWYHNLPPLADREAAFQVAMDIVKELTGMTVTAHFVEGSEYQAKLQNLVAVGQAPDVFYNSARMNFIQFMQDGALLPLNDLFTTHMTETYAKTPAQAWPAVTFDGLIYAVVPVKDLAENNSVLYSQERMDEAGVEMVEWVRNYDLHEMLYDLRAYRDEAYPEENDLAIAPCYELFYRCFNLENYGAATTTVATQYEGMEWVEGYAPYTDMFNMYDTPEFVDHCKLLAQLVTDRINPYDRQNYDPDNVKRKTGATWIWYNQGYIEAPTGLTDYVCSLQKQGVSMMYTQYIQSALNMISADTEYPEACASFIELLNTNKEMGTLFRFGQEGINYGLAENGHVDVDLRTGESTKYWYGVQIGDITCCTLPTDVSDDFPNQIYELNNTALASDNLGFTPVNDGIENEITSVAAVCAEYVSQTSLYSGMLSNAELDTMIPEFVEKLNANGVNNIVESYQAQLDAWRAANGK